MASFDVVSEVDLQEVDNALNMLNKEIDQRYDFKGSNCNVERSDYEITVLADDNYKLTQIEAMLKAHTTRRKVDSKSLKFQTPEKASGNSLRQKVTIQNGIESDTAKKIVKEIKSLKMKVQSSIRGEEVRIEGKKRDDLQFVMDFIRKMDLPLPVQFINFRD